MVAEHERCNGIGKVVPMVAYIDIYIEYIYAR